MIRVYKYALWALDLRERPLQIRANAKILHVGLDPNDEACLWAEVDDNELQVGRDIRIFGTGHEVDPGGTHVGSYVQGPFVWHVYDYGV